MSTGKRFATADDDIPEEERREVELAEKYRTYVTVVSALVVVTGSAALLFG